MYPRIISPLQVRKQNSSGRNRNYSNNLLPRPVIIENQDTGSDLKGIPSPEGEPQKEQEGRVILHPPSSDPNLSHCQVGVGSDLSVGNLLRPIWHYNGHLSGNPSRQDFRSKSGSEWHCSHSPMGLRHPEKFTEIQSRIS